MKTDEQHAAEDERRDLYEYGPLCIHCDMPMGFGSCDECEPADDDDGYPPIEVSRYV